MFDPGLRMQSSSTRIGVDADDVEATHGESNGEWKADRSTSNDGHR